MKDPARWCEANGGADAETRALLRGDQAPVPSSAEKDRVWSSLAPQLQAAPVPTHASPIGTSVAVGAGGLVGKITLGVVLVAAVGAGVHIARTRGQATRAMQSANLPVANPTAISRAVAEPPAAPASAPVAPVPTAERSPRTRTRSARPASLVAGLSEARPAAQVSAPVVEVVSNEMLEEGRKLARAREALRAHDPDRALALLESGTPRTAALAQEREALTIEALAARPVSHARVVERARVFLRAYPESPYRARIRAIVFESP